jgi:hypothetical protein
MIYRCVCGRELVVEKETITPMSESPIVIFAAHVCPLGQKGSPSTLAVDGAFSCPSCGALHDERGEYCDVCGAWTPRH